MRKLVTIVLVLSLVIGVCAVYAQASKEALQQQLTELQKKRDVLVEQMKVANEAGDRNAYNIAEADYKKVLDELEKVKAEISKFIAQSNEDAKVKLLYNKGNKFVKLGQYENAIKEYDAAIEQDPGYVRAYFGKAIALKKMRRYDEAEQAYQKVIEIDPTMARAYFNLGILYRSREQYNKAIDIYQKALTYDETLYKAYYEIGYNYYKLKNYPNAVTAYEKAVQINGEYTKAFTALGTSLIELGRYSEAVTNLEKSIQLKPQSNHVAYYRLAVAYNNLGKYNQAILAAQTCVQQKRGFAAAYLEIGKAKESLGDMAAAVQNFKQAAKDRRYAKWVEWKLDQINKNQ